MKKEELLSEIESAQEQLKDFNKFIDVLRDKDDPKGILTRLNETIGRVSFLLKTSEMKELAHPNNKVIKPYFGKTGDLVKVRPCNEEKYGDKTYLGFLLGSVATGSSISIAEDKIQLNWSGYNPAIFVPALGAIIYGYESWWGFIKSEDELKEITDEDIDNVWYVKLLREKMKKQNSEMEDC